MAGRACRRVSEPEAAEQSPGRAGPAGKPTARYAPPAPFTPLTDAGARARHSQHEQYRGSRPQTRSPRTVSFTSARSPPKRHEQPHHREKPQRTTTPGMPQVLSDYTSQKAPGSGEYCKLSLVVVHCKLSKPSKPVPALSVSPQICLLGG